MASLGFIAFFSIFEILFKFYNFFEQFLRYYWHWWNRSDNPKSLIHHHQARKKPHVLYLTFILSFPPFHWRNSPKKFFLEFLNIFWFFCENFEPNRKTQNFKWKNSPFYGFLWYTSKTGFVQFFRMRRLWVRIPTLKKILHKNFRKKKLKI